MDTRTIRPAAGGRRRRGARIAARALVLLAVTTIVALAGVWIGHRRPIVLAAPGGPFSVGRVVRTVTFPTAATSVERVLWCWYPAAAQPGASRAEYLPARWRTALEQHRGLLINTVANRDLARVQGHSLDNPPVAAAPASLPLVFLRAGLAALTADYTSLAEHLASHGFVVIGVDVPERTALVVLGDNRVVTRPPEADPERLAGEARARAVDQLIEAWTDDMVQLADGLRTPGPWLPELVGRIDPTQLAIVGHSLGGATAAEFCRRDERCVLGVDLDGALGSAVVSGGLTRPFAFVLSDHGSAVDPESRTIAADIRTVFERLPPSSRWRGSIRGANHFSFSDQMLARNPVPLWMLRRLGVLTMDPRRGLQVSADVVRRLLEARLAHRLGGALAIRTDDIPELTQP